MTDNLIKINMWDSYEALPPLERIIIIFSITALLLFAVYRIDKWVKNRQRAQSSTSKEVQRLKGSCLAIWNKKQTAL